MSERPDGLCRQTPEAGKQRESGRHTYGGHCGLWMLVGHNGCERGPLESVARLFSKRVIPCIIEIDGVVFADILRWLMDGSWPSQPRCGQDRRRNNGLRDDTGFIDATTSHRTSIQLKGELEASGCALGERYGT